MEKITLVRRRKKVAEPPSPEASPPQQGTQEDVQPPPPGEEEQLTLPITPSQAEMLRARLEREEIAGVHLYLAGGREAQATLSLSFKSRGAVQLLTAAQVCEMLRISTSTLGKLVRNGALPCYRLGRLRRFQMEEVLDFLFQSAQGRQQKEG